VSGDEGEATARPKPDELLALHDVTAELFETLRDWFDVPAAVALDLADIDSAVLELGDPQMIAALAMRKLQALRLLSTPGVRTTTDVVVAIVNDLERALLQAPSMRLRQQAAATDWDDELARLSAPGDDDLAPIESDDIDVDVERFYELHDRVHEAAIAIVRASEGEIQVFE
jgi:hypothetical protein